MRFWVMYMYVMYSCIYKYIREWKKRIEFTTMEPSPFCSTNCSSLWLSSPLYLSNKTELNSYGGKRKKSPENILLI